MISHIPLKFLLIFLGGASFSFVAFQAFSNLDSLPRVLGKNGGNGVEKVFEERKSRVKKDTKDAENIFDNVLPAITENPIIAPLIKTKKEVEETVETVRRLPEEQREAFCKQICTGPQ